jgi:hypothetical protein
VRPVRISRSTAERSSTSRASRSGRATTGRRSSSRTASRPRLGGHVRAERIAVWPGAAPLAPGRPLALRHVRLRPDAPAGGTLSADGRPPDSRRRTAGRRSRSRRGGRSRGAGALRGPAGASSGQIRWSPGAGSTTGTQRRSCRSSRGVPHPPDHASVHPSTPSTGPCRSTSRARRRLSAPSASTRGLADILVRVD